MHTSPTRLPRQAAASALLVSLLLAAGCGTMGRGQGSTPAAGTSTPAAAPAGNRVGPGMNAAGDVTDPRLVEAGYGRKVKGRGDWEGEITGRPAPGSKFSQLEIGMTAAQVLSILGQPSDQGAHPTGKAWIPFYYGSDRYRYEVVYKGQGRLLFASSAGFGWDGNTHLIWIINSAAETGVR